MCSVCEKLNNKYNGSIQMERKTFPRGVVHIMGKLQSAYLSLMEIPKTRVIDIEIIYVYMYVMLCKIYKRLLYYRK